MFERDWDYAIDVLKDGYEQTTHSSSLVNPLPTDWQHKWVCHAHNLFTASMDLFGENATSYPRWCFEMCIRVLVTVYDSLCANPVNGYFAKLLGSGGPAADVDQHQVKRRTSARSSSPISGGDQPQSDKRCRTTRRDDEHRVPTLLDNINVSLENTVSSSRSHKGRGSLSVPRHRSTNPGTLLDSTPSPTGRVTGNRSEQSWGTTIHGSDGEPVLLDTRTNSVPALGAEAENWKNRFINEVEKNIALGAEANRLRRELESANEARMDSENRLGDARAKLDAIDQIMERASGDS